MSKLILNMEAAQSIIETTKKLQAKIIADSKAALNPKLYVDENTKKLVKAARQQLAENSLERKQVLIRNCREAEAKLEAYMKPQRTGTENMHFMRAERIARCLTTEEALSTYRRNVGRLTKEEIKNLRPIYDDSLFEAIARIEPEAEFMAVQEIDNFRGDVEKNYIQSLKIELEVYKQSGEIDALIDEQIEAMAAGEEPVIYPWAETVNEIMTNARRNVLGPEPLPKLSINPYDGEAIAAAENGSEATIA